MNIMLLTPVNNMVAAPANGLVLLMSIQPRKKPKRCERAWFQLQKEYIIKLADAVIATKSADGQVQLHQIVNTTASGAVSGLSGVC
jgi:uncharacterized membrane protein